MILGFDLFLASKVILRLEALGVPWRTAEDGGLGMVPEQKSWCSFIRSNPTRYRGALARETSPADGDGVSKQWQAQP